MKRSIRRFLPFRFDFDMDHRVVGAKRRGHRRGAFARNGSEIKVERVGNMT